MSVSDSWFWSSEPDVVVRARSAKLCERGARSSTQLKKGRIRSAGKLIIEIFNDEIFRNQLNYLIRIETPDLHGVPRKTDT